VNIYLLLILISQLVISVNIHAQQLPSHVELQELGISFDIPQGWVGQISGESIILGHNSIAGMMIMTENKAVSVSELNTLDIQ
jgi:hypothetical protein